MANFLFDVTATVTLRADAPNEETARRAIWAELNGIELGMVIEEGGAVLTVGELGNIRKVDCVECDGEACDGTSDN